MKKNLKVIFLLMIFIITLHIAGNTQDITTGLVAHYEFENTTGDAIDAAGAHNGTVVGATRGVPGKVGNAFSFDGNDYITINNHSDITDYNAFTISAWVKPTATTPKYRCIISKVHPDRDFVMRFTNSDYSVHFEDGAYASCTQTSALQLNEWMHLAATWGNDQWNLYIDGVLVKTCNFSSRGPLWSCLNMSIGSLQGGSEFFIGLIDEVRIYNRALSSTDVTALYN